MPKGQSIFQKESKEDDDDDGRQGRQIGRCDRSVDRGEPKLTGTISAGSDPEEFSLSKDGTRIYISKRKTQKRPA